MSKLERDIKEKFPKARTFLAGDIKSIYDISTGFPEKSTHEMPGSSPHLTYYTKGSAKIGNFKKVLEYFINGNIYYQGMYLQVYAPSKKGAAKLRKFLREYKFLDGDNIPNECIL